MANRTTVYSQIQSLHLPEDVEKKAIIIYDNMPLTVKKWRNINGKAYFCIIEAYKSLGKIPDFNALTKKLNITIKKSNKMLKDAARLGYKPVLHFYHPHDFVPKFARYLGISPDFYDEINKLIDLLLEVDPDTYEKKPQSVAAGVICYYAKFHGGYDIDFDQYCERIGLSKSIVTDIRKSMSLAENNNLSNNIQ